MFCVPSFIQSGYTFVKNGTVAVSTTWAKQIVIIWFTYLGNQNEISEEKKVSINSVWWFIRRKNSQTLTVWMTIPFEKVTCAELLAAVAAREVLWMPGAAQCSDHLSDNGFIACAAAAFLCCGNSLTIHIFL